MGAAPNPLMAALAPMLMARLSGGGGPPGSSPSPGPGGPGTGPSGSPSDDMASASYGRELSSARQADPAALAKNIHDIKMQIGELLSSTLSTNPGVARALSKTLQGLDAAIKEATTAAATLAVASPIQSSPAMGAPGIGGPSPAPAGVPGVGQF